MTISSLNNSAYFSNEEMQNSISELRTEVRELKGAFQNLRKEIRESLQLHQIALDSLAKYTVGWNSRASRTQNPEKLDKLRQQKEEMDRVFAEMNSQAEKTEQKFEEFRRKRELRMRRVV